MVYRQYRPCGVWSIRCMVLLPVTEITIIGISEWIDEHPPIWAYAPNCVQREYVVVFNMNSKYVYVDIYIYILYILGSSCDIWVRLETKNAPRNNHSLTDPSVLEC